MREPQPTPLGLLRAFSLLGAAFLGIFSWVLLEEYLAEWRKHQAAFQALQRQVKDPHALSLAPRAEGIRQIWLADIDRVDRCTTCHLGADDPDFAKASPPFRTHSGAWLQTHRPDRFGCTVCHGGQGEATRFESAAHRPIPYWPEPMRPPELMEANCGACHRERRPRQVSWLAEGRRLIAESNCVACHEIPGFGMGEVRAPRLESVGYKARPDWIARWLKDPQTYLPRSRMPNFRLQAAEIEALSAFLLSQRSVAPLDSSGIDWKKADPDRGRAVFGEARCVSCHAIDGRGGTLGPELTQVGSKVRRDWLFSFLKDPFRDQPETLMLRYRLSDDQVRDLVAYLTTELVDPEAPAAPPETGYLDPRRVEEGHGVFVRHGCYSCHRFSGMEVSGKIGPSLAGIGDRAVEEGAGPEAPRTLPDWIFLKLQHPESLAEPSRMPTYNLSDRDAAGVTVALLSLRAADLPSSRVTDEPLVTPYEPHGELGALVRRYRCLSCHRIRDWGGELSTVPLDRIGSQLRRDYLESYLEQPSAVRVSVEERMPHFYMTRGEARALADDLSRLFLDDALEAPLPAGAQRVRQGEQLYERLGCAGCHILGGRGGYVGPELSDSGRRLKPGWTRAWLRQPQRWKPGTLQPDYGLTEDEAAALTAYLMSLGTAKGGGRP
ncbi:MAG TPA: c-type cytochrome [Vicinamibacteria bacterium]|nr:c-type cytochrome [Vicinamibacteria bacterium]